MMYTLYTCDNCYRVYQDHSTFETIKKMHWEASKYSGVNGSWRADEQVWCRDCVQEVVRERNHFPGKSA